MWVVEIKIMYLLNSTSSESMPITVNLHKFEPPPFLRTNEASKENELNS